MALIVAEAVIYLLTKHASLTVNGQSGGILVVLVIGASTDYALLLLVTALNLDIGRHVWWPSALAGPGQFPPPGQPAPPGWQSALANPESGAVTGGT